MIVDPSISEVVQSGSKSFFSGAGIHPEGIALADEGQINARSTMKTNNQGSGTAREDRDKRDELLQQFLQWARKNHVRPPDIYRENPGKGLFGRRGWVLQNEWVPIPDYSGPEGGPYGGLELKASAILANGSLIGGWSYSSLRRFVVKIVAASGYDWPYTDLLSLFLGPNLTRLAIEG